MNWSGIMQFPHIRYTRWLLVCLLMAASFSVSSSAQTSIFNIQKSPSRNAQGNTLNAVAAISKSDAWAVGFKNDNNINFSRTLTLHWDGVEWTDIPSPNPGSTPSCQGFNTGNELTSVAAVSANDVWATGFSFTCATVDLQPMMIHWNGERWKMVRTPALGTNGNSSLNGLVALAADNIYAVGYQPAANGAVLTLIEHWDGKKWTVVPQSQSKRDRQSTFGGVSKLADGYLGGWRVGGPAYDFRPNPGGTFRRQASGELCLAQTRCPRPSEPERTKQCAGGVSERRDSGGPTSRCRAAKRVDPGRALEREEVVGSSKSESE